MRRYLFGVLALDVLVVSSQARADVSSWLSMGPGYALQSNRVASSFDQAAALTFALGVGSSPRAPWVFGGIFRCTTYFGLGTDVGLAVRGATGSFARGDWGVALDLGVGLRGWRDGNYGSYPVQTLVTLGAPWGLGFGLGAQFASVSGDTGALGFVAVVEMDLLRLTVMRQGSTDSYWLNPSPAGGRIPKEP
ncbi:MAG: hypothetical protein WCI05_07605 [Myxococcales bacterium]